VKTRGRNVEISGPARRRALRDFGRRIGLRVAAEECAILDAGLTHDSFAYEHAQGAAARAMSNERLEFLGDAVLGSIVAADLFAAHPNAPEGDLSTWRAKLVSRDSLAHAAQRIKLGPLLRLGKGEAAAHGEQRARTLAAAFEALVGAAYLTEGFEAARRFVQRFLLRPNAALVAQARDPRTLLQELVQARFKKAPDYSVTGESGPAHARMFSAVVRIGDRTVGTGTGSTKKQAQTHAAAEALDRLRGKRKITDIP
jgi:ribonuclease III